MLTCKVGENIIDTFSFKDVNLREWSNKKMLKCPVCDSHMLFCHGDYKIPYFRHEKNDDCPDIYSEGITEEHLKGIEIMYNWLKTQNNIFNLQLEKWIPETRQRPDIYFERKEDNTIKKYVIEYQCSPIATKYNERHDLYRLNNINDVWILGTEKYEIGNNSWIEKSIYYNEIIREYSTKTIEREIYNNNNILNYFNIKNERIYQIQEFDNSMRGKVAYYSGEYYEVKLKTKFNIRLNSNNVKNLIFNDILNKNKSEIDKQYYNNIFKDTENFIINFFQNQLCIDNFKLKMFNKEINIKPLIFFTINDKHYCVEYIYEEINNDLLEKYKNTNIYPIIFVDNLTHKNSYNNTYIIDFINKRIEFPFKQYGECKSCDLNEFIFDGENLTTYKIKQSNFKYLLEEYIFNKKRKYREMIYRQESILNEVKENAKIDEFKIKNYKILNEKIVLIDGYYRIDNSIRFKYIKDYEDTEIFFKTKIINNIYYLKNKNIKKIYLMLSKRYECGRRYPRNMNCISNLFKKYGFNNVEIYNKGDN